jgi:hypothetical protein
MAPAPRYTAEVWLSSTTYAKDDVVYSARKGEVYRSQSNGNLGHDPADHFSPPPIPDIPQQDVTPPATEKTQEWTPDNLGIEERDKIVVVAMDECLPPPNPTDPVTVSGSHFSFLVVDATGSILGTASYTVIVSATIADAINSIVPALQAIPALSSFTITGDTAAKTITIQNASNFGVTNAYFVLSADGNNQLLKVVETQSYVPSLAATSGQPQTTRITITDDTTYPGGTYNLTVTGSDGVPHLVTYVSNLYDSSAQILQGLVLAIEAAALTDAFWTTAQLTFDPTGLTLDVTIRDHFSVTPNAQAPPQSGFWELVPFPRALADQIIRGATAGVLKEWGQSQEGMIEEQAVGAETEVRAQSFTPKETLTQQQIPGSRYILR